MQRINAIVLAAGTGKRMGTETPKQYLPLGNKPVVVHSLETFQNSSVNEIILVVAPGEADYCQREIVEKYHLTKVSAIVEGGQERYDSVYKGLQATECDYVLIHDGARAFVSRTTIERAIEAVKQYKACVVGVPTKDTIKISDENGTVASTPDRDKVWVVQTPQCFSYPLICEAYKKLFEHEVVGITDDAMVVEKMTNTPIHLVQGEYENIKITTPEDLIIGERLLSQKKL